MEEPQNLLTTEPPVVSGIFARIATPFAMSIPCGPSGKAHPKIRSSILSGLIEEFLANNPFTTWAVRSSGRIPTIFPFFTPMGERTASIMTDLDIIFPYERFSRWNKKSFKSKFSI